MTTSGSSGRKGLFVYDRPDWVALMAQFLRFNALAGIRPRLPRRLRVAAVVSPSGTHMSRRVAQSMSVGVHRILRIPVTTPMDELVDRLNGFQPQSLNSFPSMAALLCEEQRAGRLRIAPELISTSSELLTPETAARVEEAFGVRPFNFYATTEGLWGVDCSEHAGIHLFEDMTLVENVDEHGQTVPDGEPGARLLVTNLCNFTQPLIRLEVADAVTIAPEPCACGRTLRRIAAIAGRSDDVLTLGGVPVLPLHFGVVARDRDVIEFQVVQTGPAAVRVLVVARDDVRARLRASLTARLLELGVREPMVEIERLPALPRPPSGKLQLVKALTPPAGQGLDSGASDAERLRIRP
jgi:phenylacetate-coenzyme A ligase PaaK-like adenylate-forming protein